MHGSVSRPWCRLSRKRRSTAAGHATVSSTRMPRTASTSRLSSAAQRRRARGAAASTAALLAFLPAAVPLRADRFVGAAQAILEAGRLFRALVAQFQVMPPAFVVEFAGFQRLAHRAAGLVAVAAVGEAAL